MSDPTDNGAPRATRVRGRLEGTERLRLEAAIGHLQTALTLTQAALAAAQSERDVLLSSTAWRLTGPFRRIAGILPSSWAGIARRLLPPNSGPPAPPIADTAEAPPPEGLYDLWLRDCDSLTDADRIAIAGHIDRLGDKPLFTILVQTSEGSDRRLGETLASMQGQLYPHWELCILADGAAADATLGAVVLADPRIKHVPWPDAASLRGSFVASLRGSFVASLRAGDRLSERALYEIAVALNAFPDADVIYADEDRIDAAGRRHSPYFKPGWNIELMLGQNLIGGFGLYRRALLETIPGALNDLADERLRYDLALRVAAASEAARIRHVPAVLYHAATPEAPARSFADIGFDRTTGADAASAERYLRAAGISGVRVTPLAAMPAWNEVRWPLPDPAPMVSLIVPTRDKPELLACCAAAMLHRTDYPHIELIIVDNGSTEPEALGLLGRLRADPRVKVLPFQGAFNYAAINNAAVREARGEIVVLINNDIDVIESGWLREMVSLVVRPDVGAVGAKLLFGSGHIQHAGVMLGVGVSPGGAPGVAGHFGLSAEGDDPGYFGQFVLTREVSAVTGACMALRRAVYEAVGGLDAEHLPVSFNDVDLCLRIRARDLRILWTPLAKLYHLESSSRGLDDAPETIARAAREATYMRDRWAPVLDRDPFYNINLDRLDPGRILALLPQRRQPWQESRPLDANRQDTTFEVL
jgi:GT2 family glycosyltransferase